MLQQIQQFELNAFEAAGMLGFSLYVGNYTLLTFQKLRSQDALYFWINLFASSLVLISLTASFNLASAMIQTFWLVISTIAIALRLRRNRFKRKPGQLVSNPVS